MHVCFPCSTARFHYSPRPAKREFALASYSEISEFIYMTDASRETLKKLADDLLYGPRMAGHAQFRHFALLKVTEAFEAGAKSKEQPCPTISPSSPSS